VGYAIIVVHRPALTACMCEELKNVLSRRHYLAVPYRRPPLRDAFRSTVRLTVCPRLSGQCFHRTPWELGRGLKWDTKTVSLKVDDEKKMRNYWI